MCLSIWVHNQDGRILFECCDETPMCLAKTDKKRQYLSMPIEDEMEYFWV